MCLEEEKKKTAIGRFGRTLIQNMHIFHPLMSILFLPVHNKIAIKLPLHVAIWIFMTCTLLILSLSIIISNIFQSKCLDKRFYAANAYDCKNVKESNMGIGAVVGFAFFVSAISVASSYVGILKFSKNYLNFLEKFSLYKSGKLNQSEDYNHTSQKEFEIQSK